KMAGASVLCARGWEFRGARAAPTGRPGSNAQASREGRTARPGRRALPRCTRGDGGRAEPIQDPPVRTGAPPRAARAVAALFTQSVDPRRRGSPTSSTFATSGEATSAMGRPLAVRARTVGDLDDPDGGARILERANPSDQ